jgi:predicted nucleotidyltransferase
MTRTLPRALAEVLDDLVGAAGTILGDAFVGAYVTGSFALGAGDEQSDVDFVVVIGRELTADEERKLRALHDELPTRDGHWTKHLEGSYAPRADLETIDALGRTRLYNDHGHRDMQWDDPCNRPEHRWTLRERGLALAGPDPKTFVAAVPADVLRSSMGAAIESFIPDLLGWTTLDIAWTQRYAVTTLCRMLYTLDAGEVASKPQALAWALDELDSKWRPLIEQVRDDRHLPWNDPPRPGSVDATLEFAEYAKGRAG